jgi:hypothetical protein
MVFKERRKWLLAGVWQLKGVRHNTENGRCPLCLEEEDVKHTLLGYRATRTGD